MTEPTLPTPNVDDVAEQLTQDILAILGVRVIPWPQKQDVITAIAATIRAERERPMPADETPVGADEDAEPWVMPGDPLEAEPGFYVMFGATCALWEPHEDAAYVAIGLLLRRYGSAPAVRQALLDEEAELEAPAQSSESGPGRVLCA